MTVDRRQQADLDVATPTAKAENRISAGLLASYRIDGDVTAAACEVGDSPRDVAAVGRHCVLRAELGGDSERVGIPVHRNHPGTECTGDHDRAESHAAGTDHGHPLSLGDPCTADQGAVRRGETASETCRCGEVDLLREPHQIRVCSVQCDVLGEGSPVGEAWLLLSRTDLSVPGPTPLAQTAAADEQDRHPITDPPSADLLTDLGHQPGKFMTRHVREHDLLMARPRMPIAAAHSCGHHPDHNPADRGRGVGYIANLGLGSNGIQDDCAHRYSLSVRSPQVSRWWLGLRHS